MTYNPDNFRYKEGKYFTSPPAILPPQSTEGKSLIRRVATTTALLGVAVGLTPVTSAMAETTDATYQDFSYSGEAATVALPVAAPATATSIWSLDGVEMPNGSAAPIIDSADLELAAFTIPIQPADTDRTALFGLELPSIPLVGTIRDAGVTGFNAVGRGIDIAGEMADTTNHFVTKTVPALPLVGDAIHELQIKTGEVIPAFKPEAESRTPIFTTETTTVSSVMPVGALLTLPANIVTPPPEAVPENPPSSPAPTTLSLRTGDEIQHELESRYGDVSGNLTDAELEVIGEQWGGHRFVPEAAVAFRELAEAFERDLGQPLLLTDSYRDYAAQVDVYHRKPGLAAKPGTSIHGWGMATDLTSNVNTFGTPQHNWMAENGTKYGWHNPDWAHDGVGREEAWHWEYIGGEVSVVDGVGYHVAGGAIAPPVPADPGPEPPSDTEGGGIFDGIDDGSSSQPVGLDLPPPPPPDEPPTDEPTDPPAEEPAPPPPPEEPQEPPQPPVDMIPDIEPLNNVDHARQLYIVQWFANHGLAPVLGSGIVGNGMVETMEGSPEEDLDPTEDQDGGGDGQNIFQWSRGGRWPAIVSYCASLGLQPYTLDCALEGSLMEMQNPAQNTIESKTWAALQAIDVNAPNAAEQAAIVFQDLFERPGIPHTDLRIQGANETWALWQQATSIPG